MKVLTEREYGLFERLVAMSQQELHKTLGVYLKGKYKNVIIEKEYVVAIGDIPIALVAHLDTVFGSGVVDLYYDQRKGMMWSPQGLGSDDRAGIFAILQIVQSGLRPSIILTTDEERGGLGAQKLAKRECPIPFLRYMIQLDRRGNNDCVFYDCYCPSFIEYVESFGFLEKKGSYSDISFLMPAWQVCGVNLSVGYEDEHSYTEHLDINALFRTIKIVTKMLTQEKIPHFPYKEAKNALADWWNDSTAYYDGEDDMGLPCCKCGKYYFNFELIPVKGYKVKKMLNYCPDCVVDNVNWYDVCGKPYEMGLPEEDINICQDCTEELTNAENN